jgi:hypothetical protein
MSMKGPLTTPLLSTAVLRNGCERVGRHWNPLTWAAEQVSVTRSSEKGNLQIGGRNATGPKDRPSYRTTWEQLHHRRRGQTRLEADHPRKWRAPDQGCHDFT